MNVALVYDRVNKIGGAERILTALHELFPEAPLYTAVYRPNKAAWAAEFKVVPSFLQRIPFAAAHHEWLPGIPFMAFERFDFSKFDTVISVTSAEAKGIITPPDVFHLCYCLTPTRYLWSNYYDYFKSTVFRALSLPAITMLREYDYIAAQRPDSYIAISQTVRKRIAKYYRREADVVYPPVDTDKFRVSIPRLRSGQGFKFQVRKEDYYLVVSRLVEYKHIELAIEACNRLKRPLKIIGSGSHESYLKRIAGPTVEFLGNLTDRELVGYYQECRALLFPQEEDFGITLVEALASGKAVIAYQKGGAGEIITPGTSGELFAEQTVESLIGAVGKFEHNVYNSALCRKRAALFSKEHFKKRFLEIVESKRRAYH